ncbi:MAG: glycosyltransferase [Bacteroidota bacterium]
MNVLLNFFPVQSGGGQQVASNFLKIIASNGFGHNWFVFVGKNSELHKQSEELFKKTSILSMHYSYMARILNKKTIQQFINDNSIDIVYNYAPVLSIENVPQVVRTVYSNLYFPEIDFWKDYSQKTRLKKKIIDHFRLKGTLKADGLIFENKSMQERVQTLFNYDLNKTLYVEPSVTLFDEKKENKYYEFLRTEKAFKILYLSSWHLNKNIHLLPEIAKVLKEMDVSVKFILSLDKVNPDIQKYLIQPIVSLNVEEYFEFIGKVESVYVHQVIKNCDAMILLSKLECFSSNIIEAFYFKKPLIISDEPWAYSECKDAVLYVSRDNVKDIADKIQKLILDFNLSNQLVNRGNERLVQFNSPTEKVAKQIYFLEKILKEFKE